MTKLGLLALFGGFVLLWSVRETDLAVRASPWGVLPQKRGVGSVRGDKC